MPKKLLILSFLMCLLVGCSAAECDSSQVEAAAEVAQFTGQNTAQAYPFGAESYETEATSNESQAQYFTFQRICNTVTNESGLTLLYERYCDNTFTASDLKLDRWVNGILSGIQLDYQGSSTNLLKYANEFLNNNDSSNFYSYSNYQELGVARHDQGFVSLLSLSSLYSGGVHPSAIQTAYNLDLEHQRILSLEDVIYADGADELADMVFEGVTQKFATIGEGLLFDDYQQTIATSMSYGNMTPYWYLNNNGLVIFYNQYELGPYAAGIINVELLYEDLEGILLEDYFPGTEEVYGDLVMKYSASYCDSIPITIESDGEVIWVGVEGQVFQIQISQIFWLEDTPILKEMIFSANTLGENDVLEITGAITDDGSSIAIEFIADGQQKIYYIRDYGLSEDP